MSDARDAYTHGPVSQGLRLAHTTDLLPAPPAALGPMGPDGCGISGATHQAITPESMQEFPEPGI